MVTKYKIVSFPSDLIRNKIYDMLVGAEFAMMETGDLCWPDLRKNEIEFSCSNDSFVRCFSSYIFHYCGMRIQKGLEDGKSFELVPIDS